MALSRVLRDRNLARAQRGMEERAGLPAEWRKALGASDYTLYVTPDELEAIDEAVVEIWRRYQERIEDPAKRPEGSLPIQVLMMAYPHRPGDA
jgi:hypothetical protein